MTEQSNEPAEELHGTCNNCITHDVPLVVIRLVTGRPLTFCKVCSESYLLEAEMYPNKCKDPMLHKSLAWCTNAILKEIRQERLPQWPMAQGEPPTPPVIKLLASKEPDYYAVTGEDPGSRATAGTLSIAVGKAVARLQHVGQLQAPCTVQIEFKDL